VFPASLRLAAALLAIVLCAAPARAQIGSDRYSSIVIDASNAETLSAVNADEPRHPASLTKMMTLYMVFEALRDRRIALNQYVPVSAHAASMEPSKLGLMPGTRITVQQAILGLVTKSANDAAAALGELLGGDEERFGQMMTLRARALGMSRSVFRNASGLPDPAQVTTAHDMAILARHLVRDFPADYRWFSTPNFAWHGHTIYNHDNMLKSYPGADGIKTGYIDAAGHNLVTSAVRGDVRLIGVVFGAASNAERDIHMTALLDQGFERMDVPSPVRIANRVPSLVAVASAAPMPTPRRMQMARWSVQIGAFSREGAARQAAATARRVVDDGDVRIEPVSLRGHTTWRAFLTGFSPAEAHQACTALARRRMPCTPIRPEAGQLASR
jgi:D-alanyl-D-alanine carboxypeptidase